MIRIKQTIKALHKNKEIKSYLRNEHGFIMFFDTIKEAQEKINLIIYCEISKSGTQYKITGKV